MQVENRVCGVFCGIAGHAADCLKASRESMLVAACRDLGASAQLSAPASTFWCCHIIAQWKHVSRTIIANCPASRVGSKESHIEAYIELTECVTSGVGTCLDWCHEKFM